MVSFLTREQGRLRGVAKRARKVKSAFGSGLERLSQVRMAYFQRENRELVNLDSCELIQSQFRLASDYRAGIALDFMAEITEQMLPPAEPNERYFRLMLAVLEHLRAAGPGGVFRAATYFALWAVRLSGFLPDLKACIGCGSWLNDPAAPERAFFSRVQTGLVCAHCRAMTGVEHSWELSFESRQIAAEMLRVPVGQLSGGAWTQATGADLRRFLVQAIEGHIERRLVTAPVLEAE